MPLYLFTGDHWLRQQAIERLRHELTGADAANWTESQLDGESFEISRFVEALQSKSLFDDGVIVHVKRIDCLEDPQLLIPYLEKAKSSSSYVILQGDKLNKRGKFYKTLSQIAKIQDYTPPNRRDLPTVAAQLLKDYNVKLSGQGFRYLLENVDADLTRIGREAEKISLFAEGREVSVEELRGLLFHDKEGDLFAALDALMERRSSAIAEIESLLTGGEEPGKVFYIIAGQIRSLIKIKALASEKLTNDEIAAKTGDFSWLVAKRRKIAQNVTQKSLRDFLHKLHDEDVRIKRGERQPEESLWVLIFEWLALAASHSSQN